MPRRHSPDGEQAASAVASAVAARRRRTSVLLDKPTRRLLCGSTTRHASTLLAGGFLIASRRSPSQRRSNNPPRQDVRHRTGRHASNDLHQCRAIVTSAHRREALAMLHELQPWWRGTGANSRSQLLGWRITCPLCGSQLRDAGGRELPSPFRQYRVAALGGEKLLDDEAERGIRTWTSPADITRLLLMRRIPTPIPREHELWRFRVLGASSPISTMSLPNRRTCPHLQSRSCRFSCGRLCRPG